MSVTAISYADFQQDVLESPVPVLVDFWANWCVPCKKLAPILEELSETYSQVKFVSVDTEENPDAMLAHDIRTLPTVLIFRGGELVESFLGDVPKLKLRAALDSL
ncbi:MAG: thioredoxin [Propionibacteriaceae bacterium]|jgi:thioredoxin 1|nr:thioredoxin [Propionibacteriaceae bacterium]